MKNINKQIKRIEDTIFNQNAFIFIIGLLIVLAFIFIVDNRLNLQSQIDNLPNKDLCITSNYSLPPLEQFCQDNNMSYLKGNLLKKSGCVDDKNEIHYYLAEFKDGYWIIGETKYKAEWTGDC